jgi:hypothetical protein
MSITTNLVIPASPMERRPLDNHHHYAPQSHGLQINIQGTDSDGSFPSHSSWPARSSSSTLPSTSTSVEAVLVVKSDGAARHCETPILIDVAVDSDAFNRVMKKLKTFRVSCNPGSRSLTIRCILSKAGSQSAPVSKPCSSPKQLELAVQSFRSGDYDTLEIEDTIELQTKPSQTPARTRLREGLSGKRVLSELDGFFIPESSLEEILNDHDLESLCSEDPDFSQLYNDNPETKSYRKLLATCLLAGINSMGEKLCRFQRNELLDDCMPFNSECRPGFFDDSDHDYQNICDNQWQTIPFQFKPYDQMPKTAFDKEIIIPIIEKEELDSGGFGSVFKVRIHEEYQKIPTKDEVSSVSTSQI